jgi:hypothetical protein
MIQELRIYRFHAGQKKVFLKEFKKAKSFMKKYGVTFVAAWENPEREDEFIWLRSLAYYGSPEWAKIVDTLRPTIRRREVRLMNALPYSTIK